jgi:hypothetical protein
MPRPRDSKSGIVIRDVQRQTLPGLVELSALIEGMSPGEDRLWFRFPMEFANWLTGSPEPMVAALLPIAMLLHRPLYVEGHLCNRFLSGCRQIISLYSQWDTRLHPIEISSVGARSDVNGGHSNGVFFTAGVDSFYTLLKNLEREQGDSRISHLIFIRGYADCPLDQLQLFENLAVQLRKVAEAYSLDLILAETNLKAFTPPPASSWDWNAGSQLASVGLCLEPGLRRILIPAGDTYSTVSPWGSHPLVDPLWSTKSLEFRHDGCEAFRSQKLESYIVGSRVALENLRVCGYDLTGKHNCGACEKCLRTLIGLAALDTDVPTNVFASSLDLARVRQLDGGDRVIGYYLRDNLRLLEATGAAPDVERAVRQALRPSGKRWLRRRLQTAIREIDRRYFESRVRVWMLRRAGMDAVSHADLRRAPGSFAWDLVWRSPRESRAGKGGIKSERASGSAK